MTKEQIEDIRRNKPIVDVFRDYGIKVNSRGFARCCFHDGDKGASLKVYPSQNSWYCFGCHAHGDQFDFVQKYNNVDLKTAFHLLGGEDKELSWAEREKIRLQKERRERYRTVLNDVNKRIAITEYEIAECERGIRFEGILQGTITENMVDYGKRLTKATKDLEMYQTFKNEWIRDYERYI